MASNNEPNQAVFIMSRKKREENPELHKDLKGFDIKINEFGELSSSFSVERLNRFLNEQVEDKKLRKTKAPTDKNDKPGAKA